MDRTDIEAEILARLAEKETNIRNKNAIGALFGAFSDPIGSLGKIFIGGDEAVEFERQRLQQDEILNLLCKLDDVISDVMSKISAEGIEISGLIETSAQGGDSVVGVDIGTGAGPVRLQPGTHIKTRGNGTKETVGLKITSK